jgi:hypothetical protein
MEPQTRKSELHSISCTECHRRKQKCSRSWPCNHCQTRKVPHLCHFPQRKSANNSESLKNDTEELGKRKLSDLEGEDDDEEDEEIATGRLLKAFGYLEIAGNPAYGGCDSLRREVPMPSHEIQEALASIPAKQYCDAMVQNYLEDGNYQYYILYPPKFLEDYQRWWEMRANNENLSPSLTCLILRVLALSTQSFTSPVLRARLETGIGADAQTLTDRYQRAAQRLSDRIPHGEGGVMHVQEMFMSAPWHKSESQFVGSWHALSAAIRQAQEIG